MPVTVIPTQPTRDYDRYGDRENGEGIQSLYRKLPTNMRLLLEQIVGVERPITEEDFRPEELEWMRKQIRDQQFHNQKQEESYRTNYEWLQDHASQEESGEDVMALHPRDRPPATTQDRLDWLEELEGQIQSYEDTRGRTSINPYFVDTVDQPWRESLSRSFTSPQYNVATSLGKYVAEDVDGGYRIKDKYDFNRKERQMDKYGIGSIIKRILLSPELAGEHLMSFLSRKPREVDVEISGRFPQAGKGS